MTQNHIAPGRLNLPPDGRQTRIDFFGDRGTKRSQADWWQHFSSWFRTAQRDRDPGLDFFMQQLEKEGYSKKSGKTYLFMMKRFFDHVGEKDPEKISMAEIEDYNYEFFVSGRYSRSYQLQFINAIKLYFRLIRGVELNLKHLRKSGTPRKAG
jgi:hypothetical protein